MNVIIILEQSNFDELKYTVYKVAAKNHTPIFSSLKNLFLTFF
jgi:hypothetical protein